MALLLPLKEIRDKINNSPPPVNLTALLPLEPCGMQGPPAAKSPGWGAFRKKKKYILPPRFSRKDSQNTAAWSYCLQGWIGPGQPELVLDLMVGNPIHGRWLEVGGL